MTCGQSVMEQKPYNILVVNRASCSADRERAQHIGRRANQELEFDFGIYDPNDLDPRRDPHAFLGVMGEIEVGVLVAERRGQAMWTVTWAEYDSRIAPDREIPVKGYWSVTAVWVAPDHRRHGMASLLVHSAAAEFGVELSELGWYTPFSDAGESLVRSLCSESFLIVK